MIHQGCKDGIKVNIKSLSAYLRDTASDPPLFLLMILIAAAAILVNYNLMFNGFVYDDITQVLRNPWITDVRHIPDIFSSNVAGFDQRYATSYYRPMMHVIYMCCYYLFGLEPWGYHLVNMLFHAGVSILVFLVASKLLDRHATSGTTPYLLPSFMAAMLFAAHPVHSEPVAWVAAVPDLSFTFFYMLSFYLYIRATDDVLSFNSRAYLLSLASFFIATLCKEPALSLPVMLFVHDYALRPAKTSKPLNNLLKYIPFLVVACAYFIIRFQILGAFAPSVKHWNLTHWQYFLNALVLFGSYMGKLLLPINLSVLHLFHPITSISEMSGFFSLLITAFYLIAVAVTFKKQRTAFFCLMFFAVTLLPALYIPALGESPLGERQLYLPSFGFVMLLALIISWARAHFSRRAVLMSVTPWILVAAYSAGTIDRNSVWKDEYSLWSDAAKKSPDSATAHEYLGYALYVQGRVDDAISQYRISLSLNPQLIDAHVNLGIAYDAKNMTDQAIEQYRMALKIDPNLFDVHDYLGEAYVKKKMPALAFEQFQSALRINPSFARAYFDLGVLYWNSGSFDKAVAQFENAVKFDQGNQAYREALAKALGPR